MPTIRMRAVGYTPEVFELTEEQQRVSLKMWLDAGAVPVLPPFVPKFEEQHFVTDPTYGPMAISRYEFATEETANEMMHRFNAARVVSIPYMQNSPEASDAKRRWLVWGDGIAIVAGTIAKYFLDAPEDTMPGSAKKQAEDEIARARQENSRLPAQV